MRILGPRKEGEAKTGRNGRGKRGGARWRFRLFRLEEEENSLICAKKIIYFIDLKLKITDKSFYRRCKCALVVGELSLWPLEIELRTILHRVMSIHELSRKYRTFQTSNASKIIRLTNSTAESCEKLILPIRFNRNRTWFEATSPSSTVINPEAFFEFALPYAH